MRDLEQVAAGVVNTAVVKGSIWSGLLGDHDGPVAQPLELDVDAGHGKGGDPGPLPEAKHVGVEVQGLSWSSS